jgi:hypothetical protein
VPLILNRPASSREAELLVRNFDQPSSWTSMHRPGIASVVGDRLFLNGTTIDEVSQYHAKTVSLAVRATNAQEAELRAADEAAKAQAADQSAEHKAHVAEVARDITFG